MKETSRQLTRDVFYYNPRYPMDYREVTISLSKEDKGELFLVMETTHSTGEDFIDKAQIALDVNTDGTRTVSRSWAYSALEMLEQKTDTSWTDKKSKDDVLDAFMEDEYKSYYILDFEKIIVKINDIYDSSPTLRQMDMLAGTGTMKGYVNF